MQWILDQLLISISWWLLDVVTFNSSQIIDEWSTVLHHSPAKDLSIKTLIIHELHQWSTNTWQSTFIKRKLRFWEGYLSKITEKLTVNIYYLPKSIWHSKEDPTFCDTPGWVSKKCLKDLSHEFETLLVKNFLGCIWDPKNEKNRV